MISRRTARIIAEVYERGFRQQASSSSGRDTGYYTVNSDWLYDFLFENEYPAYLCNLAKATRESYSTRRLKEFVMKMHTGESLAEATANWTWEQRESLGQRYLLGLAEDFLNAWKKKSDDFYWTDLADRAQSLLDSLELDGYTYKEYRLIVPEQDVLDVQEEEGVLKSLYTSLCLANKETAFHHLKLSEDHYLAHKWDDSIANSRKFLEAVLQQVAIACSQRLSSGVITEDVYLRPVRVREYLQENGLLESKEKEALASVYGLLSSTGGHPYIAHNEQARLLRHLALTFAQFVMLRYQGSIRPITP